MRRACHLLSVARSAIRYESKLALRDAPVVAAMRELGAQHPRWVVLTVAAFLANCTLNPRVELYNHTHSSIQITSGDDRLTIEPEKSATFANPANQGWVLSVCLNGSLLNYSVAFVPPEYFKIRVIAGRIRAQVDEDRQMRVLKPDEEFPLGPDKPQPDHFPMTPKLAGSC